MGDLCSLCLIHKDQIDQFEKENDYCRKEVTEQGPANFYFNWDMKNPCINKARIKGTQIILTEMSEGQQGYKFSSQQPFPETGVYKVIFGINKFMNSRKNRIYFGITTTQYKYESSRSYKSQRQSAFYQSSPSGYGGCKIGKAQVQAEGISSSNMGLLVGQKLQMVVNMNDRNISFKRKASNQRPQINIPDMPLPSPFIGTSLYPFIQLYNYGDIASAI